METAVADCIDIHRVVKDFLCTDDVDLLATKESELQCLVDKLTIMLMPWVTNKSKFIVLER